jgi:hypothetical protein
VVYISTGKSVTGRMIFEKAKYFYDEIKITDWFTFSEGWLQTLKDPQLHVKTYGGIGIV